LIATKDRSEEKEILISRRGIILSQDSNGQDFSHWKIEGNRKGTIKWMAEEGVTGGLDLNEKKNRHHTVHQSSGA